MTRPRRVFACSSVAIDYFDFLGKSLAASADEVVAVTAVSEGGYRRAARGSRLARLVLRLRMYLVYPAMLAGAALRARQGDTFVVTSNTFFAPAWVALLARWRGIRVVHVLYDLYPDAIEVAGRITTGGVAAGLVGWVTRLNQRWTAGTVYLGDFLRDYAERRWGHTKQPVVIPIATDVRLYGGEPPRPPRLPPLRLHYGGQLGLMHDADSLLAGLRALAAGGALGTSVHFDALISGGRAGEFEAALRNTPGVHVAGTLPSDSWRRHAEGQHVGVVTLSPGGATVCLPSKTYAMMAAGLAIVAVCPRWSDLARLVEETGAGWVVNNAASPAPLQQPAYIVACRATRPAEEVGADFCDRIRHLAASPAEVQACRENAWRAVRDRFSPDIISRQWSAYLAGLAAGGGQA